MIEPDHAEAARRWRKRAEVLWKVARFLDDLAVRYRNAAHACDREAAAYEELVAEERGRSAPRPP